MLLTISCISVFHVFHSRSDVKFEIPKWLFVIPVVFGLLGSVFSGQLANAKLGNYRVMKYSFVLLFLFCLLSSVVALVPGIAHYVYVVSALYCIGGSLFIVAVVACFVTFTFRSQTHNIHDYLAKTVAAVYIARNFRGTQILWNGL